MARMTTLSNFSGGINQKREDLLYIHSDIKPMDENLRGQLNRQLNRDQNLQNQLGRIHNWSGVTSSPSGLMAQAFRQPIRLHRENGPACYYENGTVGYFWRGVRVPEFVIMNPDSITLKIILRQKNIEIRRCLIERFTEGRFLKELGAKKETEDDWGILWLVKRSDLEKEMPDRSLTIDYRVENEVINWNREIGRLFGRGRILKYVQVKDPSTDRQYFLPVPSTIHRAKQAIAWTFHLKEEEYQPQIQT